MPSSGIRGRRECRALGAPAASGANEKSTPSKSTTVTPETPGIPRAMVLTVSFVVSPENRACCLRRRSQCRSIVACLIPASGYQDATTSPSATRAFVSCACCVHRIPCPTFCDDRETPLMRAEDARKNARDLPDITSEKVCGELTRRANQVMRNSPRRTVDAECHSVIVIPGQPAGLNPESISPVLVAARWIPGSPLSWRPGMTANSYAPRCKSPASVSCTPSRASSRTAPSDSGAVELSCFEAVAYRVERQEQAGRSHP